MTFPGEKCSKSNEREQNFGLRDGQGKDRPGAGYPSLSQVHPLASCVYSLSRRPTLPDDITQAPWPSGFRWPSGEGGWGSRQKTRGQEERDSSDFFPVPATLQSKVPATAVSHNNSTCYPGTSGTCYPGTLGLLSRPLCPGVPLVSGNSYH